LADRPAGDWVGRRLGERTVAWTDRDPILFAAAIGAPSDRLDLVFERDMRVLPPFALTLTQWAPDLLGAQGGFDATTAVHAAQRLDVLKPLAVAGELAMSAHVSGVHDKGGAALYDITVESDAFVTTWSILAPGRGGFGGDRGPSRPADPAEEPTVSSTLAVAANAAVLYRLLADRHPVHIDPATAARFGQPRPVLHGLATLAACTLPLAEQIGAHPADLTCLRGHFATPVLPGETMEVRRFPGDRYEAATARGRAIRGGVVRFS